MSYELRKHKKSDAIKWVIVFVLILALIAGMLAVFTGGFKNWDARTWFGGGDDTEQTDLDKGKEPADDKNMQISSLVDNGISLFMSPAIANTVTGEPRAGAQTVSVSNPIADVTYNWALSWNGNGNVLDYVSLSATTGVSVTVSALQAFDSQITLTCTAVNSELTISSATCKIDYVKRILGVRLNGTDYTDKTSNIHISLADFSSDFAEALKKPNGAILDFAPIWSKGSIEDETYNDSFFIGTAKYIINGNTRESYNFNGSNTLCSLAYNDVYCKSNGVSDEIAAQAAAGTIDTGMLGFWYAIVSAESSYCTIDISYGTTDNFKKYNFILEVPLNFYAVNYNVSLNNPQIIF